MKCYFSSSCIRGASIKDVLDKCFENNIKEVELSAPHTFQSVDEIKNLLKEYQKQGFSFIPHNYFPPQQKEFVLNLASADQQVQELSRRMMVASADIASTIGSPIYGVHIGYLADPIAKASGMFEFPKQLESYSRCLDRVARFIDGIVGDFNRHNVTLLLENLFPLENGNFSVGCNLEQIKEVMSVVPKNIGLLLDLGHLNISSHYLRFDKYAFLDKYLEAFGDRLYEVHLSENNGLSDEHLAIQKGSWQLDVIKRIEEISLKDNQQRKYCLEARNAGSFEKQNESLQLINAYLKESSHYECKK